MNARIIINTIGRLLQIEAILLVIPIIAGIYFSEGAVKDLITVAAASFIIGMLLMVKKPEKKHIRAREGFVITKPSLCFIIP